jgi:hypothetical protein
MTHYEPREDSDGFLHTPHEEWVGYPINACSCGKRWPCDFVRAADSGREQG